MKVKELMTKDVEPCTPFTSLAAAVEALWRRDCGVLPVIDAERRVAGVITDRDIAIALGTREQSANDIPVGHVMSSSVFTCGPDDEVSAAMASMREHRVRRLPVVDSERHLVGILSIHDLARAVNGAKGGVSDADLIAVMRAIGQEHPTRTGALWA